jgi:enterochelin esterase-like enzyme
LEAPGIAVNAVSLIRRIPKGLRIEGLKETLEKVFSDADLQLSLSTGGASIHATRAAALSRTLHHRQRRGTRMDPAAILKALGIDSFAEARPRSRHEHEDAKALAREEIFVFLDGQRMVPRTKLEETKADAGVFGRASTAPATSGTGLTRARAKRQHQSMASKLTLCAVNRSRLLEIVEQG